MNNELKKTIRKVLAFLVGMILNFAQGMSYAEHAPFFPTMAQNKGSSVKWVGVITGSHDLMGMVCTLTAHFFLTPKQCCHVFLIGSFILGIAVLSFAFTIFIPNIWVFNFTCFFIRCVMGGAGSIVWSSGLYCFTAMYINHTALVTGIVQAVFASGQVLGPAAGSLLYSLGGYKLPFLVTGCLQISLVVICCFILETPESLEEENSSEKSSLIAENETNDKPQIDQNRSKVKDLLNFICHPNLVFVNIPFYMNCIVMGYLDTALGPYLLKAFSLNGNTSGYIFLIYTSVFALGCVFVGKLADLGIGSFLYLSSMPMSAFAALMLFLPSKIPYLEQIVLFSPCLAILGFSLAMSSIPSLLMTEKAAIFLGSKEGNLLKPNVITLYFLLSFAGRFSGASIIGGVVLQTLGFYWTALVLALLMVASLVVSYLIMRRMNLLHKLYYWPLDDVLTCQHLIDDSNIENPVTAERKNDLQTIFLLSSQRDSL